MTIASIPYPLAMWSVLGMPQNGHHDHKTLRQWASFSGDTSWIRYIKPHYQIYRTLGRESPERLLPFRHVHFKPQSDERLRLPTTCDYLRPAVIVGSRSDFYHNRTSSHTLRSLYDRSSMIVAFWSLSRMQVADCCTTIVRPSYDHRTIVCDLPRLIVRWAATIVR